jgi:hypothetical protein
MALYPSLLDMPAKHATQRHLELLRVGNAVGRCAWSCNTVTACGCFTWQVAACGGMVRGIFVGPDESSNTVILAVKGVDVFISS